MDDSVFAFVVDQVEILTLVGESKGGVTIADFLARVKDKIPRPLIVARSLVGCGLLQVNHSGDLPRLVVGVAR